MTSQIRKEVFFHISRLEIPLWTIKDILTAIDLMAPNMNEDANHVAALQRLVTLAESQWQLVESYRCSIFDLSHADGVEAKTEEVSK